MTWVKAVTGDLARKLFFALGNKSLPPMKGGTVKKEAAIWALNELYGKLGYPADLSMQDITNAVNKKLKLKTTPPKFRVLDMHVDTIERLLGKRR